MSSNEVWHKNMKKQKKMRVVYHYVKPKDEAEAREQSRNLNAAFDILFNEVEKERKAKKETENK